MNTPEKIEAAGKKKEEGNLFFKAGKYAKASKKYEKVHIIRSLWHDEQFYLNHCFWLWYALT